MLSDFISGIKKYGIPSRIRLDKGGEFVHIQNLMEELNGFERRSFITGKSVHNIRIERLWRDVFSKVINKYYLVFNVMENNHILDINNGIHMAVLHHVYGKKIQKDLSFWMEAHNNHPVRTENNKSPFHLWYAVSLMSSNKNHTAMNNLFRREYQEYLDITSRYEDQHSLREPDSITRVLPRFSLPLTNAQLTDLNEKIDVTRTSQNEGVDIYYEVLQYIDGIRQMVVE